jgi:serine/threonine-protein kinase
METVDWLDERPGRPIPIREDSPVFVFGDWDLPTGQTALPDRTRLSGRLYFAQGRVYGRFTEAHTPTGQTYPVCMELFDDGELGMALSTRSEPGKPMVAPSAKVRVVDRFQ